MSVQAMGWVLDHSPTKGAARLVLLSIANHAGQTPATDDGPPAWEAWPGVETIAREARLKRVRTVTDTITALEVSGDITRVVNGAPDERIRKDRRSNLYRILLQNGVSCGDTRCRWCGVSRGDVRGDVDRRHGVTDDDATGCRETTPEPSEEPSVEPDKQPSLALVPPPGPPPPVADPFDEFWASVPKGKRVKVGDARKAWTAALRKAPAAVLIAGMVRYAGETIDTEPRYVAAPSAWLRAERWLDEPDANRTRAPRRGGHVDVDRTATGGVMRAGDL